jgi:hypothetical protein
VPARLGLSRSRERRIADDYVEGVDDRVKPLDARERIARHLDRREFATAIAPHELGGGQIVDLGHGGP